MKVSKKTWINLRLMMIRGGIRRGRYLQTKEVFKSFGENVWWQPFKIPSNPEVISVGDNVNVATEVLFLDHDIIHVMLNNMRPRLGGGKPFKPYIGPITIGNNVFIGGRSIILYNVKIGNNCIIAAGSLVNKDVPDGAVVAGVPAKVIGKFEKVVEKYRRYSDEKIMSQKDSKTKEI